MSKNRFISRYTICYKILYLELFSRLSLFKFSSMPLREVFWRSFGKKTMMIFYELKGT